MVSINDNRKSSSSKMTMIFVKNAHFQIPIKFSFPKPSVEDSVKDRSTLSNFRSVVFNLEKYTKVGNDRPKCG